jgi:phosphoglycerate dehydrogenase-like enzyme
MRVVYWARLGLARQQIIDGLHAVPDCELVVADNLPQLLEALPGAQALVLYDAPPPEASQVVQVLSRPDNAVRWMHFVSAGREGFEAVGLPKGMAVTFAAGAVSPAVAEHAMALLLALKRRVPEMVVQTAEGRWDRGLAARASSLEGERMAIIGLGHIGEQLARRAKAFGMRVDGVTRSPKATANVDSVHGLDELHAVLADADAVAITIALTRDTRHLIGREALAACKRGAMLVNVARGGVIDQAALCEALRSGQIGGAGLDVTDPEPLPAGDALWRCPNVLISPHFAGGGSAASIARLASGVVGNLRRLQAGEALADRVQ